MNFKRIGRALVCLLLVCCLCFNIATMPAKAAVLVDDLVLLGIMGAALLLLGGVVFNAPTQDDFRSIGQSFSNALDSAAKTDEQTIIITAVRQDLIEQARQGMNYNKPPQLPLGSFDFWVNAAIMAWIASFLNGQETIDNEVTSYNGVYLPAWGQYYTAGTTITMPQHPGYTDPNTFTVNNTDYSLYRFWSGPSESASMYSAMYFYCIIAEGDIQFDVSTSNSRTRVSQYSQDYLIDVDGQLYSWCNVSISYSTSKSSTAKISEFDSYRSGCFVTSDYRLGVEYSSANSPYGPLQKKILGGTIVSPSYDSTSRNPDMLTGGIKDYLDNGGSLQDIVLPDIDLSGIMGDGKPLDEAVGDSMSGVADGSQSWQDYVDAVTPNGDITTNDGNEITDSGVSEDVGLWGLLKRMADYLLNGLKNLLWAPIRWLGNMLLEGIQAIFVPSEDFLTDKVDALRSEFTFADAIISTGEFIGGSLEGITTEPPVIYLDLAANRGPYDIGGKVAFIDMTWYAEYKPTVDLLLSSFLWIVFWWKMFKRLPGLISGAPGDFVMEGLTTVGLADYLPSRNVAYEIQRRDNHNSVRRRR